MLAGVACRVNIALRFLFFFFSSNKPFPAPWPHNPKQGLSVLLTQKHKWCHSSAEIKLFPPEWGAFPLGKSTNKSGNSTSLAKLCPPARLRVFVVWGGFLSPPKLCLFHVLRQQICEPQTMASFCRQWSARGMSQEGRAWGGTISFHKPAAAEWVMPGGSCCHQDSNSKAPFTGPAAPEKGGEGPLEDEADGEKAASSCYLLPRLWG